MSRLISSVIIHSLLEEIVERLERIEACVCPCPQRSLNPQLTAIYGRKAPMPVTIPVPALLDVEKIKLSVMPRLFNGHVSPNATITWTESGDVGVEPGVDPFVYHDTQVTPPEDVTVPGNYNCYALTPGSTGTGTVTSAGTDAEGTFDPVEFGPITWAPGQPRSLNASLGSPVSDV